MLECEFSSCVSLGFSCVRNVESSWTKDQTCVPCIGRWIPIHCIIREVFSFKKRVFIYLTSLSLSCGMQDVLGAAYVIFSCDVQNLHHGMWDLIP